MRNPNKKCILLLLMSCLVFLAATILALPPPALKTDDQLLDTDIVVKNLKLYVRGKEYFVKGINYSPQPQGASSKPNGGFCSDKTNSLGQVYSACRGEDYFDGAETDNNGLPAPNGPWWKNSWERDFKVISQELKANTIRVYHMGSVTRTLLEKFPEFYPESKYKKEYAPVHKPFLDTAYKYGLKVIVPIVSEENILSSSSQDELMRFIEARVDELGNHEALLMWLIGNELGLHAKPALRTIVNFCMDYTRNYTMKKWNRIVPVTTAEIDLPTSYVPLVTEMKVDVYTSNAGYRDIGLASLWEPDLGNKFEGWTALSNSTGLPILIGEFGSMNQDERTARLNDWVNQQWRIMINYKVKGCIGGLFFEFNEEPLKPEDQRDMGLVKFIPTIESGTGKKSTDPGVFIGDTIVRKDIIFQAIQQGLPDSKFKNYSFASDIYELSGTQQTTIDVKSGGDPPAIPSESPYPTPPPVSSVPIPEPTVVPRESQVHPSEPEHSIPGVGVSEATPTTSLPPTPSSPQVSRDPNTETSPEALESNNDSSSFSSSLTTLLVTLVSLFAIIAFRTSA